MLNVKLTIHITLQGGSKNMEKIYQGQFQKKMQ